MTMIDIIKWALLFLALNLSVFSIYFMDKQAARCCRRRISERTLLILALIGGSLGALAAQQLLRHKTRKEPFRSILAAILILHGTLIAVLAFLPQWSPLLLQDF
ncbi:DUF1294 domain-containing protein [Rhizobium ruizarguesonis]|uniref:DUF1294 domain-containing protein n=1 Tax=Rhizobium ruizarguesonis TaxID=2081791 RepID=UPI0010308A26|nr:DUF1294 domain-containing protein [Rhizobium ruizarguesonis]TBE86960.1 DUF1294 domain-containing protein [Rhizobium ruizarguesonis]